MEEKRFYAIQQQGRKAELAIFGPIRSIRWEENDVTAWNLLQELRALDADEIHVHINSPGGNVGEAFAIYNVLREHPARVTTYADGYVASAAIYAFLAGERRIANPVSAFYFHPVQMEAYGGPEDLRKAANAAELLTEQGLKAFQAAGVSEQTARELVERDDFAAPEEMVALGVATELGQQDSAEEAQQSILPMVTQILREHRKIRGTAERLALEQAAAETQRSGEEESEARKVAKLGGLAAEGLAEGLRKADENAEQKDERTGLRGFFDGLLRDLVQGTPEEGAGAPTGLLNDRTLRAEAEHGKEPENRLQAWLGLQRAE